MNEPLRLTFEQLRRQRRTALIPFLMGGDPSLALTGPLLLALEAAGADLIEIGLPFSDPLADGPIIQASSARALCQGATPVKVLAAVRSVRQRLRVPVVCLSYWNPVIQFGRHSISRTGRGQLSPQPFIRAARESGISGIIVPDLPIEEGGPLRAIAAREQFAAIFLAAPTSPPPRLRAIARASEGFIYYVSVTGTTGVRQAVPASLVQGVRQLKALTPKPVCVGFGISTPSQAAAVARIADGVIVGSALIQRLALVHERQACVRAAAAFVQQLRRAV